ncbi:CAAX prenyl protease 2-like [Watersipora subatra]|uniref:CAAX prenyl protease 2-like n=1 Tax=Watersipora subatra TaxID=2589382 RepID=UPI00355B57DF
MSELTSSTINFDLNPLFALFSSFLLAFSYVSSLYIKSTKEGRNHPMTIKIRFLAVTTSCVLATPFLYLLSNSDPKGHTLWEWLGLRSRGLVLGGTLPLLLTMILFCGPLVQRYDAGVFEIYRDMNYWKTSLSNIYWIRNHIMGPVSEEFLFRACLMPLMVPTFGWKAAVCFCPIFFGLAHFHHMLQKIQFEGLEFKTAFFQSAFQFCYTTTFGAYCAYIFVRTGHLLGPILCHSFCNHMGLPDINEVLNEDDFDKKARAICFYLLGPVLFFMLLKPLTTPVLFSNDVYYQYL